jgi:hypothetical protein
MIQPSAVSTPPPPMVMRGPLSGPSLSAIQPPSGVPQVSSATKHGEGHLNLGYRPTMRLMEGQDEQGPPILQRWRP